MNVITKKIDIPFRFYEKYKKEYDRIIEKAWNSTTGLECKITYNDTITFNNVRIIHAYFLKELGILRLNITIESDIDLFNDVINITKIGLYNKPLMFYAYKNTVDKNNLL